MFKAYVYVHGFEARVCKINRGTNILFYWLHNIFKACFYVDSFEFVKLKKE